MKLTQEENMTLDLMIANINDDLKDALVTDGRESDAEVLQERYSLLRKLRQLAAPAQGDVAFMCERLEAMTLQPCREAADMLRSLAAAAPAAVPDERKPKAWLSDNGFLISAAQKATAIEKGDTWHLGYHRPLSE